jgi:hypothetical protein
MMHECIGLALVLSRVARLLLGACHSTEQTGPDTPLGYFHCYRLLVSVSVSASAGLFPFKAKCKDV